MDIKTDTKSMQSLAQIGIKYSQIRLKNTRFRLLNHHNNVVNWLLFVQKQRCFCAQEASALYKSAKALEIISTNDAVEYLEGALIVEHSDSSDTIDPRKLSQYTNAKRNVIRNLTWGGGRDEGRDEGICPCCQQLTSANYAHWLVVPYWVSYGFVRVCRDCIRKYKSGEDCIHVYYQQFIACRTQCTRDYGEEVGASLAWQVFQMYIDKGMVHDVRDEKQVDAAREYMQYVVNKLSGC